jgi:uroporphyrinogen-III synthase
VFFASSSAVDAFITQWSVEKLKGKSVAAIGKPTCERLLKNGVQADAVGKDATVESSIMALAEKLMEKQS